MTRAQTQALRVGLIVNPWAGVGGAVALKGSDGEALRREAVARGGAPRGVQRARDFLTQLLSTLRPGQVHWFAGPDDLGADLLGECADNCEILCADLQRTHDGEDTCRIATAMLAREVALIVFCGGDGTARDILRASPGAIPVLGIPAGVKMHSGVFAVTPRIAADVVAGVLEGRLTQLAEREVVDWAGDEQRLDTRVYGALQVPEAGTWLQQTKTGGRESEPLALAEICADVCERVSPDDTLILGPGGTLMAVKTALGLSGTLRGFDARLPDGTQLTDIGASEIEQFVPGARVFLSFTRGQGFLLGRGNQQLSVPALRAMDFRRDVQVLATRTKVQSLDGRPLLVDTGDDALDQRLAGLIEVVSGYEDRLLYRVSASG